MGQNIRGGVLFLQLTLFSEFNLVYNASIGDKCRSVLLFTRPVIF